jgi:hypothetical protein
MTIAVSPPKGRKLAAVQLLALLLVAAVVRLGWMWFSPPQAISADLKNWPIATASMVIGDNPYSKTTFFNWPPFWMELLYFLMKISLRFDPDNFVRVMRCALIVADLGLLAATFWLMRVLDTGAPYMVLLLIGYCLNPLPTLLTIQHGNFDAFAAIWIVLFFITLIRYRRSGEVVYWLMAAGCLGMGGFTKTFPLFLWPLLVPDALRLSWRARLLGMAMVAGPAALALAPLYVLDPASIIGNVLQYRSFGSSFGLIGLLQTLNIDAGVGWYGKIFPMLFLGGLAALALVLCRWRVRREGDLVLIGFLILLTPFTFGTGYGPQYWFWVLPLYLVCYRQYGGALRKILLATGVIIVLTNIVDYAVVPWLGELAYWLTLSPRLLKFSSSLFDGDRTLAYMHLPMTAAVFVLYFAAVATLAKRIGQR